MTHHRRAISLFALTAVSLAPLRAQDAAAERVLELIPRPQPHVLPERCFPPVFTLLPHSGMSPRTNLLGSVQSDGSDECIETLLELLHGRDREHEALSWSQQGAMVALFGSRELVTAARAGLTAARAMMAREIEITAELYDVGNLDTSSVIVRDDATTGRGALLWRGTTSTTSGKPAMFDALRWSRYCRSLVVEVAQKSMISSPDLGAFGEGIAIALTAHALANSDDIVLFAQFAAGERIEVGSVSTGVPGQSNLDLPSVATVIGAGSARVPAGAAMQFVLDGDPAAGPRYVLVLRPRYVTPAPAMPADGIALFPFTALTTEALLPSSLVADRDPLIGDYPQWTIQNPETPAPLDSNALNLLVVEAMGQEDKAVARIDGWFAVRGSATARSAAAAVLTHLQDQLLRTEALRAATELHDVDDHGPFAAARTGGRSVLLHRVLAPTLVGHQAFAFRGIETNAIRTMTPEIAQEASIAAPIVEVRQNGLWLRGSMPRSLDPDAVDFEVRSTQHTNAPLRSLAGATGAVQLADIDTVSAIDTVRLPAGTSTELAQGTAFTIAGRSARPVIRIERPARR